MKKGILLSVVSLIALGSYAQSFSLGFNASPNLGWLSTADTDIEDNYEFDLDGSATRLGFGYGIMVEYHLTENYHIGLNVNHLMTGGKFLAQNVKPSTITPPDVNNQKKVYYSTLYSPIKLNYLYLPLSLRLKTNEIGYFRYFGNIGFAGAFNVGSKADVTASYFEYDEAQNQAVAVNDDLNESLKFQPRFIGTYFAVGAGTQYSMGGNTLLHFGIDVNIGLGNVISKREYESYSSLAQNVTAKNSFVALNIGIFL